MVRVYGFLRDVRIAVATAAIVGALGTGASADTLADVRARGNLACGVNQGLPGFSIEQDGKWTGFDADFCRAVAAAIFHDPDKVTFVPLSASDRFKALQDGKVDILSRNTTWTMQREAELGLTFVGVTYYDGQGFMVPRSANLTSSLDLGGTTVCVQGGTTTEANLVDYFVLNTMIYEVVKTASAAESMAKYAEGACNVVTSDMSQLYALRGTLKDADEQLILADTISKEPLGPAVRQDDPKWATLVKWIHFALLNAEELGITSVNTDIALRSIKPDVLRFVGVEGDYGTWLGLENDWAVAMVKAVGNYGEIYDRNLGTDSPLGIPRGMNQLWNLGGIQYAPPIR
jgi:general L-amino acid transport system substrate-binding protein